jgi:L-lysine 2,3-aminomutase
VNDNEEVLLTLSETLINHGIIPYYLHQLDPVSGSAHFFVSQERGFELIDFLKQNTSGYGVPQFVKEEPGKKSKTLLHPINGLKT